jgi:hypothetical protein
MSKLAKAIIAVMKAVKNIEKNSTVGSGQNSYNGVKDRDVKEIFNEQFSKNGLCILPIGIEDTVKVERWQEETNWGTRQKQSVFCSVKTKYLLLHESGESMEICGYGHGVDPQDKASAKATTYALKNCLLYTFLTPVGDMPDTDTVHSDSVPVPQKKAVKKDTRKAVKDNQLDTVIIWAKDKNYDIVHIENNYILSPEQKAKVLKGIK